MVTFPGRYKTAKQLPPKLRTVGVDDGIVPPIKRRGQSTLLAAVLFEGTRFRDVKAGWIEVDGTDANSVLQPLLEAFELDAVILSGISFAGFNLIDIRELSRTIRRPVIAISGEKPDNTAVLRALRKHFTDWKERWRKVRAAGELHSLRPLKAEPPLFFEVQGGSTDFAKHVIKLTATVSRLPEPVRVAGILAKALSGLVGL